MARNIIKYLGIALVIVGIVLVMKNLFTKDDEWSETTKKNASKNSYYSASIRLVDKESNAFITGAKLVLKKENGEVVEEWTTEGGVHLVNKLKNGKYVLIQESATEDYHLNEDGVSFEIDGADSEVIMYNIALTEEEKAIIKAQNTTASNVNVDNTLSKKSIFSIFIGIASIIAGVALILVQRRSSSNDV